MSNIGNVFLSGWGLCYVMFMEILSQAETIRQHLLRKYFEPARRSGSMFVTVRAGDIHKELGLQNRVANVCQVMESRLLLRSAGVKVSSKQAPPKGRGTTVNIVYMFDSLPEPPRQANMSTRSREMNAPDAKSGVPPIDTAESDRLFYQLRGAGADVFAAYGGGEAFLRKERAEFYGASRRED